jgi:hypothetical protein
MGFPYSLRPVVDVFDGGTVSFLCPCLYVTMLGNSLASEYWSGTDAAYGWSPEMGFPYWLRAAVAAVAVVASVTMTSVVAMRFMRFMAIPFQSNRARNTNFEPDLSDLRVLMFPLCDQYEGRPVSPS